MIEYNISLIFNKVWSIFSNRKGEKRQKCTFLSYKMHFFKNCKNDPIITCDMSFERFFHGENNTIIIFVKYWKLAFLETKTHFCFFCNFFLFLKFCTVKANFQYFSYLIKILNPTYQDLSIDILQVKIWRFLRVWPRNSYNSSKKVCFSFLGHFRWKKFNQTLLNLHEILYSIITYLLKSIIY